MKGPKKRINIPLEKNEHMLITELIKLFVADCRELILAETDRNKLKAFYLDL